MSFDSVYTAAFPVINARVSGWDDLENIDASFVAECYEEVFMSRELTDPGILVDPDEVPWGTYEDVALDARDVIHGGMADAASANGPWASEWESDWED
jgi:hypothetical protein